MKKRYLRLVKKIKERAQDFRTLPDEELRARTDDLRQTYQHTLKLLPLLIDAFALVYEAVRRTMNMIPYDVQLLGAIAMAEGTFVEMKTGEGKTLTAVFPLFLHSLTGQSVICVTQNSYLAQRDAREMSKLYHMLGVSVRAGVQDADEEPWNSDDKREIYAADVVYSTYGAFGFDYLLENLVKNKEDRFLRPYWYVLIDEADVALLDSARTPLVISGAPWVQSNLYHVCNVFVSTLLDKDYEKNEYAAWLTDAGVKKAEEFFNIKEYFAGENFELNRHVLLALRAHMLFEKDKDYIISDGELVLVDNHSGRKLPGMKMRGGQMQALEEKEGMPLSTATRSVASITFQNLFLNVPIIAGMSGTMWEARKELRRIYKRDVMVVPTHKPIIRQDLSDGVYVYAQDMKEAAISEAALCHKRQQPVLLIVPSIEETEEASQMLLERKIPHNVLNAKDDYWEAQIIKEAGRIGAVTVATAMAGRGTDIRLENGAEKLGGLAVIVLGRMADKRLEQQVRGRAGRQGDPGVSKFYVSLEDEVALAAGAQKIENILEGRRRASGRQILRLINRGQRLEADSARDGREQSLQYDNVMKRQRDLLYTTRNTLLDGENVDDELIEKIFNFAIHRAAPNRMTPQQLRSFILGHISYEADVEEQILRTGVRAAERSLKKWAMDLYQAKCEQLGEHRGEFVRLCMLAALDTNWVEEVDYLQQLRMTVSGRGFAQRNVLSEYQNEAYKAFGKMKERTALDMLRNILLSAYEVDDDGEITVLFP